MSKNSYLFLIIGIITGGLLVYLFTQNSNIWTTMSHRNNLAESNNSDILDTHFIEQMIPHHEDAIKMANLALVKSDKSEILQLSENIIKSQSTEINQMKSWYQEWFNHELPSDDQVMKSHGMMDGSTMYMSQMGFNDDMSKLENATDFDRVFLEDMIPHHQMAVMMANMLERSTIRPEMKQLAQDIIKAQTLEIDQMRQWYSQWGY